VSEVRGEWLVEYAPKYFDPNDWSSEHRKGETFKAVSRLRERLMDRGKGAFKGGDNKKDKKRKAY
jgi:hypothetical protein